MPSRHCIHRLLLSFGLLFALPLQAASDSSIDTFFAEFTDRWVARWCTVDSKTAPPMLS